MARKQAEEKKVTVAAPAKPIRVDLPPEIHKMVSVEAAHRGLTLAVLARMYVEQSVKADREARIKRGDV